MDLSGKVAVVAGGTGGVGEGIVVSLVKEGATVVVPSRSEEKIERLKAYVGPTASGKLDAVRTTLQDEETVLEFQKFLQKKYKQVDIAVASLGGWWQGAPVYSTPFEQWKKILDNNLTSHFLAIKALIPMLNPETGAYFHINGFSAEQPYAGAASVAMAAAAQKSLVLSLAEELKNTGINVHELILGPMKTRDRIAHGHGSEDWYSPGEIGEYIIELYRKDNNQVVHHLLSKATQ